jgi:NTP pyrophosphatase (non-canonical NTP hydrolase)
MSPTTPEQIHKFLLDGAEADEYQALARRFAIFPGQGEDLGLLYCALKLAGEAGEVAENFGKAIRDDGFLYEELLEKDREAKIVKELGDVLWYVAMMLDQLDVSMAICMETNLQKLHNRSVQGTLQGEGSDR